MKINYEIVQEYPGVYSVQVADDYDRAMLFCKVQEFYESPNKEFKGKDFSMWDYMKWYSQGKGSFTYPRDWNGFNIPLQKLYKLYGSLDETELETPYDKVMSEILWEVFSYNGCSDKGYVIGVKDRISDTFNHELCHALFATNKKYKKIALENVACIKKKHYNIYKKNLLAMGYMDKVIDDEIQAYMMFGWNSLKFSKGVPLLITEMYHTWFDDDLNNTFLV
jgi:hypothetical protein